MYLLIINLWIVPIRSSRNQALANSEEAAQRCHGPSDAIVGRFPKFRSPISRWALDVDFGYGVL